MHFQLTHEAERTWLLVLRQLALMRLEIERRKQRSPGMSYPSK